MTPYTILTLIGLVLAVLSLIPWGQSYPILPVAVILLATANLIRT